LQLGSAKRNGMQHAPGHARNANNIPGEAAMSIGHGTDALDNLRGTEFGGVGWTV